MDVAPGMADAQNSMARSIWPKDAFADLSESRQPMMDPTPRDQGRGPRHE
jgi:hypothetical protein